MTSRSGALGTVTASSGARLTIAVDAADDGDPPKIAVGDMVKTSLDGPRVFALVGDIETDFGNDGTARVLVHSELLGEVDEAGRFDRGDTRLTARRSIWRETTTSPCSTRVSARIGSASAPSSRTKISRPTPISKICCRGISPSSAPAAPASRPVSPCCCARSCRVTRVATWSCSILMRNTGARSAILANRWTSRRCNCPAGCSISKRSWASWCRARKPSSEILRSQF